ncbi:hypothetical protein BV25DRAFT_1832440 [Artomyces pyxidatus]|uniref:Uncharacterized protein n=1 Tax=Artomyces pyxidatus TaxID=48021 RepID=A0ACB8SI35_9AGAM|nr:hypothetical protein BV25DRAFT_1832440 [Artomyces pyxidatus]
MIANNTLGIHQRLGHGARATQAPGPFETLHAHELGWRNQEAFLESKGYMLRPRLRPG